MRALVRYVSKVDSHTESALRVITYFDALVEHRATLEGVLRAAAGLSQCPAGLRDDAAARTQRFNQRGLALDGSPLPTMSQLVRLGDRVVGEVWLERQGEPAPLDDLVVERMALATGALWRASPRPARSAASLIEMLIDVKTSASDRSSAVRALGLLSDKPIYVAVVATSEADGIASALGRVVEALKERSGINAGTVVRAAVLGTVGAILRQESSDLDVRQVPAPRRLLGLRVGTATASSDVTLAEAWRQAEVALRFCGALGFGNEVAYESLGSLATLASITQQVVETNPDIVAIGKLASTERGKTTIRTLDRWLAFGSTREAAAALHVHHSSVSYQLQQAEKALGLSLAEPQQRLRADVALALWKLSAN